MKRIKPVTALILALFMSYTAMAADWTRWRGTDNNWQSRDTQIQPENMKIVWTANVGLGHSSVTLKGDWLFTMGEICEINNQDTAYFDVIHCLDRATGNSHWTHRSPTTHGRYPGPGATPAIDGDRIYAMGRNARLVCLDLQSGRVIWQRNLIADSLAQETLWGLCCSPLVWRDRLLLNIGESGLCLDKSNGKTLWSSRRSKSGHSTPRLRELGDKVNMIFTSGETLFSVDVMSGKVNWTREWYADIDAVVLQDRLYLTGGHIRGRGSEMLSLTGSEPEVIWESTQSQHIFQPPIIRDEYAYLFHFNNRRSQPLQCVNLQTGEMQWEADLGMWGALTAAGDRLIIATGQGELVIAPADPSEFREIARFKVLDLKPWNQYKDGEPHCVWTVPVLADGQLFIRSTRGELVCLSLQEKS